MLRAEGPSLSRAEAFLAALRQGVNPDGVQLIGPLPAPTQRRGGRYRAQLLARAPNRSSLQRLADVILARAEDEPDGRRLRWSLDIDPLDTF